MSSGSGEAAALPWGHPASVLVLRGHLRAEWRVSEDGTVWRRRRIDVPVLSQARGPLPASCPGCDERLPARGWWACHRTRRDSLRAVTGMGLLLKPPHRKPPRPMVSALCFRKRLRKNNMGFM